MFWRGKSVAFPEFLMGGAVGIAGREQLCATHFFGVSAWGVRSSEAVRKLRRRTPFRARKAGGQDGHPATVGGTQLELITANERSARFLAGRGFPAGRGRGSLIPKPAEPPRAEGEGHEAEEEGVGDDARSGVPAQLAGGGADGGVGEDGEPHAAAAALAFEPV